MPREAVVSIVSSGLVHFGVSEAAAEEARGVLVGHLLVSLRLCFLLGCKRCLKLAGLDRLDLGPGLLVGAGGGGELGRLLNGV